MKDNDPWEVHFHTRSRDGAIKASSIIARAIDSDRITSTRTKIFILGGAGKSLVMDAIARDISDYHSPFKMPPTRFVEGKPSKALGGKVGREIVKGLVHKGKSCVATFCHLSGVHHRSWIEGILSKCFNARNVGLDFMTEINEGFNETFIPDISIRFHVNHDDELEPGWGRDWIVKIEKPELRTPEMQKALQQLAKYEERRQQKQAALNF